MSTKKTKSSTLLAPNRSSSTTPLSSPALHLRSLSRLQTSATSRPSRSNRSYRRPISLQRAEKRRQRRRQRREKSSKASAFCASGNSEPIDAKRRENQTRLRKKSSFIRTRVKKERERERKKRKEKKRKERTNVSFVGVRFASTQIQIRKMVFLNASFNHRRSFVLDFPLFLSFSFRLFQRETDPRENTYNSETTHQLL